MLAIIIYIIIIIIVVVIVIICFFRAMPAAYGSSQARDQIKSELQLLSFTTATQRGI